MISFLKIMGIVIAEMNSRKIKIAKILKNVFILF